MDDDLCPACGSALAEPIFEAAVQGGSGRAAPVMSRCRRCRTCYLRPRFSLQELAAFYPAGYYSTLRGPWDDEPNPISRWEGRRHFALRCAAVNRAQPVGGRLLDLGCGTGGFLDAVARSGRWRGIGVDFSEHALAIAARHGLTTLRGDIAAIGLPDRSFDAVTMWEVIEHLPDPCAAVREVYRVLKPGGHFFLSTPNSAAWQANFWGRFWVGWDPPRHLQVFTLNSLQVLLAGAGLETVARLFFPAERYYMLASARLLLAACSRGWVRRGAAVAAVLASLAAWPALRLIDRAPRASSLALECVRR